MKISASVICTFLLMVTACSQGPYEQDLGQIASMTFPHAPKTVEHDGNTVFGLDDNGITYVATASLTYNDFKGLAQKSPPDSLFNEFITGTLRDSDCHLLYKKPVTANGLNGVEFAYETEFNLQKSYRYHQVFYINNTIIAYGYWSKDSLFADDKGMRAFFSTFKLKKKN
jgi:hypothetical protein